MLLVRLKRFATNATCVLEAFCNECYLCVVRLMAARSLACGPVMPLPPPMRPWFFWAKSFQLL